ncbi:MAG: AMP-binding protein [Minwuia sp.]|uniref:AMP-binding protein n=1 Tax=Minwuia sp. TaxID=2493630 RepID=UPI003A89F742
MTAPIGGRSHVRGDTTARMRHETVSGLLRRAARKWPDRPAAVFREQDSRWTWAELDFQADRLAGGLLSLGLYKGDRVGIWSPNRAEWLVAQFATARLGLILVNINPAYRRSELEYALNKVGCAALITATRFRSSDYVQMLRDLAPELDGAAPGRLRAERLPKLRTVIHLGRSPRAGIYSYQDVMDRGRTAYRSRLDGIEARLRQDEAINIQFTSGTTGAPKGATLTHRNIVNNGLFCGRAMALTEQDRLCIPVPLYHCFGMVLGNLAAVAHGACMVFPGEAFEPGRTLETLAEERCTAVHGVPTMFLAMVEHPDFDRFDLSSLRTGIISGAPCPVSLMRRVMRDMNAEEITIAYGMTETSPVSFQTAISDPVSRRTSTVGRVQPHAEVKVIDEAGEIVPVGGEGELCTRGYLVMQGYWDDPERTAESIDAEGWMHTGDLGRIDAEGYANIIGRVKDMVIRGGENIYPAEIEEFLRSHPDIADVQVFGVPDDRYGEELCAWIVTRGGKALTADEVRDFCDGQIAHYKRPRYVKCVAEFPMTVTGKARKVEMREAMIAELGLKESVTA